MKKWLIAGGICVLLLGMMLSACQKPVQSFDLNSYTDCLASDPADMQLGPIHTAEEAQEAAKDIWLQKYGDAYQSHNIFVFYDEAARAWLLQGHNPLFSFEKGLRIAIGGEPYIIIDRDTGEVLALWHTK